MGTLIFSCSRSLRESLNHASYKRSPPANEKITLSSNSKSFPTLYTKNHSIKKNKLVLNMISVMIYTLESIDCLLPMIRMNCPIIRTFKIKKKI